MSWLKIVGLGPGNPDYLTLAATEALGAATDLVGYGPYVERLPRRDGQIRHVSDNRVEVDRAGAALDLALGGARVAIVSGGDPGIFAMAAAVFEAIETGKPEWRGLDIEVIPGISAVQAAAASIAVTPGSTRMSSARQAGSPASSASNTADAMANTPGSPPDTSTTSRPEAASDRACRARSSSTRLSEACLC